jgi:HSP20 family protein
MLTRRPSEGRTIPLASYLEWLLDDPWSDVGRRPHDAVAPSIDVRESDDALTIEASLPGIRPDDIEVSIDGRALSIRAKSVQDDEQKDDKGRYLVRERREASYFRVLMLPVEVDADHVKSSFENGELKVVLPKAMNRRSRRIPISGASNTVVAVGPGNGKNDATSGDTSSQASGRPDRVGASS